MKPLVRSLPSLPSGPSVCPLRRGSGGRRRGFTLIELMVVVLIIGILATIAIPTIGERLRERRSSEVAIRVAQLYRQARLRSMGRGSAIMVNYSNGVFTMLEAIRRPTADNLGCVGEAWSSCLLPTDQWNAGQNNVTYQTLGTFDTSTRNVYADISIKRSAPATASDLYLDVCFTPGGRTYTRAVSNATLAPMAGVFTFTVDRGTGSLTRTVAVLPNGVSRLTL